ncbi:hypothetical protein X975_17590, partial [Stegodyphus mimosarum]
MPITRSMEEQLRQLIAAFVAFKEEIKAGQEYVKEEIRAVQDKMEKSVKEEMKTVQEKMEESVKDEMKAVKEEMKVGQEEMKSEITGIIENKFEAL